MFNSDGEKSNSFTESEFNERMGTSSCLRHAHFSDMDRLQARHHVDYCGTLDLEKNAELVECGANQNFKPRKRHFAMRMSIGTSNEKSCFHNGDPDQGFKFRIPPGLGSQLRYE